MLLGRFSKRRYWHHPQETPYVVYPIISPVSIDRESGTEIWFTLRTLPPFGQPCNEASHRVRYGRWPPDLQWDLQ